MKKETRSVNLSRRQGREKPTYMRQIDDLIVKIEIIEKLLQEVKVQVQEIKRKEVDKEKNSSNKEQQQHTKYESTTNKKRYSDETGLPIDVGDLVKFKSTRVSAGGRGKIKEHQGTYLLIERTYPKGGGLLSEVRRMPHRVNLIGQS